MRNNVNSKRLQVTRIPIAMDECSERSKIPFNFDEKTQICAGGERGKCNPCFKKNLVKSRFYNKLRFFITRFRATSSGPLLALWV